MVTPGRQYSAGSGYRYGFQSQEKETDLWNGGVVFKYRIADVRIGKFFCIDPLASSFPWNSPYAFSENRVIDGIEMEGLEVVLVNKEKDKIIYDIGVKNKDKSAVHIYCHGTPSNMQLSDGSWSHDPKDFESVLKQSDVYQSAKENEKIIVIMHSCRTGRSYFDEGGNYVPSLAEQLSGYFSNLIIVAPDERDNFSGINGEIGPLKIKYPANKRADYTPGKSQESSDEFGNWNVFENGKWTGQFDSDYDPSTAPKGKDFLRNYNPVSIHITGTVNADKLNIRSSAGFGDNVIGQFTKGAKINLTGNINGTWSEIALQGGGTGWVATEKIKKNISVFIDDEKKK